MAQISSGNGGLFFLDASGCTGKTFLINLLLAEFRSNNNIALAVAPSGIAATLLDRGRTAHSALGLPFNLTLPETPVCNITKGSGKAKVLQTCKVIVWDDCTMAHKKAIEALDCTLKDLRGTDRLMGGSVVIFASDFCQTLPVLKGATPVDELNACLKSSYLWIHAQKKTLTTNMRVHLMGNTTAHKFTHQLLCLGNDRFPTDSITGLISFPEDFCEMTSSVMELIDQGFPDICNNFKNHQWLCEHAILELKNDSVSSINLIIQGRLPGLATTYMFIDSVKESEQVVMYPLAFLNSLEPLGMPLHKLTLKIGATIILPRNLDPPKMCNGTRLCIKSLMPNVIEATILMRHSKGANVFIPRIPLLPSDMPFSFKHLQFPIRLAFAMTINKAQALSMGLFAITTKRMWDWCWDNPWLKLHNPAIDWESLDIVKWGPNCSKSCLSALLVSSVNLEGIPDYLKDFKDVFSEKEA
ncbi:ATP-dependent DNA helicase PIF1-like [Dendrobates tinctorius]|uniref:ATP-dependent DNA helicase PIF1-like n=1 Tax=Dendrobates tinctorius TaxID=92724 RepID=UPI003CC96744